MSVSNSEKIKIIDLKNQSQRCIDLSKISDIDYSIKKEAHRNIKGIDPSRLISYKYFDKEDIDCII